MARKFVRNITGTKLKGENKEPLKTNMQNDLLSDDEDVYVRNKDEYHCLTDNLKELTTSTPSIVTIKNGKNSSNIDVKETKIESESERITINNPNPNDFKINIDLTDIENITDIGDGEFPEIDLSNYALRKDLNNHTEDFNNPHKVDLEDLGIENLPETVTNIENDLSEITTIISEGNNKMTTKFYDRPNVDVYLNKSEDVKECILIDIDNYRDLRIHFRESSGGYPVKSKFIIRNLNSDSRRLKLYPDPVHIFTLNGNGDIDLEGRTILVLTVLYNITSKDGKREIFLYEDAKIPLDEVVE